MIIVVWLIALVLAPFRLAEAQQSVKVAKIGWLGFSSASGSELLRREFRSLGYIEGKNIAFEYRDAQGKFDRLSAVADELVRLKIDVIVTSSSGGSLAAKNATRMIPIVFQNVADPVAIGLVDSLARPGGNITGFTIITAVLAGKRLGLLKETIPKLSRVAVLWNPQNPGNALNWKESQLPARELGLELYSMEVKGSDKFESAFKEAIKAHSAALAVTQSPYINAYLTQIADLAAKSRLPTISPRGDFVESGGLMSYGADQVEAYRRLASTVDKILKGAIPADLPVEQPTKFEFVLNLKAAKQIGLTIPQSLLYRADKVFK
jgi:putative ABC transport system substrate-binding protein